MEKTGYGIGDRRWTCFGGVARTWPPCLGEDAGMGKELGSTVVPLKKRCTELLRQLCPLLHLGEETGQWGWGREVEWSESRGDKVAR